MHILIILCLYQMILLNSILNKTKISAMPYALKRYSLYIANVIIINFIRRNIRYALIIRQINKTYNGLNEIGENKKNITYKIYINKFIAPVRSELNTLSRWLDGADTHYDIERLVLVMALLLSSFAFIFYYSNDLITAYGDSKGHLNITRRVVDSLTPGLAQLGGYWLPISHVLMFPTIWIDAFYKSGISGSLVGMVFFIISVVFTYKSAFVLTNCKKISMTACLVLLLNPNLLFLQTSAMTESVFVGLVSTYIYFLVKYIVNGKVTDIVSSAFFVAIATLTRYEGWGLLAVTVAVLCIHIIADIMTIKHHPRFMFYIKIFPLTKYLSRKKEGVLILFTTLASMGIVFWLLWGLLIFKDPLEFLHNDLSAGNQTKTVFERNITGHLNFYMAFLTNILAIVHVNGVICVVLSIIGYIILTVKSYKTHSLADLRYLLFITLLAPLLFDIISVFLGNVPVEVEELKGTMFNIRYAVFTLPFLAMTIAQITKNSLINLIIVCLILVNTYLLSSSGLKNLSTLQDSGVNLIDNNSLKRIEFLKQNYNGGYILASTGSMDGFMFDSKIDLKNYVVEGTYRYWDFGLKYPARIAKWVVYSEDNERDAVFRLANKSKLKEDYDIVYQDGNFKILKRKE